MIPDIEVTRNKARAREDQLGLEKAQHRAAVSNAKYGCVKYYYATFEKDINASLNAGEPGKVELVYRDLMDFLSKRFSLRCEDYEMFEIMDAIFEEVARNYSAAKYTVEIDRQTTRQGSHFTDKYVAHVTF